MNSYPIKPSRIEVDSSQGEENVSQPVPPLLRPITRKSGA
jgi:hypothetical protein